MVRTDRKLRLVVMTMALVSLTVLGCKSAEEKSPAVATVEQQSAYIKIVADAQQLDNNYQSLQASTTQFLEQQPPQSEPERSQWMTVAVIAAAAHWWEGKREPAAQHAVRAYTLAPVRSLPEWEALRLLKTKPYPIARKWSQAKDFIIANANGGVGDFQKGNETFIGEASANEAIPHYQAAISKGLENNKARRECYLRLAGSLFKSGNEADAEKIFAETWLLDPVLDLTFGDESTRDFLNGLAAKYEKEFVVTQPVAEEPKKLPEAAAGEPDKKIEPLEALPELPPINK